MFLATARGEGSPLQGWACLDVGGRLGGGIVMVVVRDDADNGGGDDDDVDGYGAGDGGDHHGTMQLSIDAVITMID